MLQAHVIHTVLFGAIFTIVFESIVLALTWNRTAEVWMNLRRLKINTGLVALLWRDGSYWLFLPGYCISCPRFIQERSISCLCYVIFYRSYLLNALIHSVLLTLTCLSMLSIRDQVCLYNHSLGETCDDPYETRCSTTCRPSQTRSSFCRLLLCFNTL